MEPQSTLPVNEGSQTFANPASFDTPISQTSILMSKGQPVVSPLILRRRGHTKRGMTSTVIKRSASSPNVRTMASSEASSLSLSDKRRNKLGYHRTSVACGHCRRRKIRCLLAPGDPQGRCSNCIRLKKECNFYPVDQQPLPEKRPRSGSKAEASSNDAETSTSSSPAYRAGSNLAEEIDDYHQLQPHPLQTNQENQSFNPYSASTLSPPDRTPMSGLSYDFHQNFDSSPSWDHSPFMSHSPQSLAIDRSNPGEASSTWGRPTGSPMTGAYPPSLLSMHSSSLSMTPSSQGSREAFFPPGARDDRNWNPPSGQMRSMSLVTPEELPPHYQARFLHQSPASAGRVPVPAGGATHTPYNHAAQDAAACVPQSSTDMNLLGHHGHTGQQVGFNYPQWGSYPQQGTQMVGPGAEGYPGDWYTGSPNLAQVREEDSDPHHFQPASRSSHHRRNPG